MRSRQLRKRREEWGLRTPERARESAAESWWGGGGAEGSWAELQWICKTLLSFQLEDGSEVSRAGGLPGTEEERKIVHHRTVTTSLWALCIG